MFDVLLVLSIFTCNHIHSNIEFIELPFQLLIYVLISKEYIEFIHHIGPNTWIHDGISFISKEIEYHEFILNLKILSVQAKV